MEIFEVTIASGASVSESSSVTRNGLECGSVILDGTYTNTSFDVQAKIDGTWYDVYDIAGNKVNITVADGKHSLAADDFKDVNEVRLSGASNEGAERTVKFLFVELTD